MGNNSSLRFFSHVNMLLVIMVRSSMPHFKRLIDHNNIYVINFETILELDIYFHVSN